MSTEKLTHVQYGNIIVCSMDSAAVAAVAAMGEEAFMARFNAFFGCEPQNSENSDDPASGDPVRSDSPAGTAE